MAIAERAYGPITGALYREYPDKYPRVCGSAHIAFTRLRLVRDLGIPLRREGGGERLEIVVCIYDPPASSSHRPLDHCNVRYHNGGGRVLVIDKAYYGLWGKPHQAAGPLMGVYAEDEVEDALRERFSIAPFSAELASRLGVELWPRGASLEEDFKDMSAALHDDHIFGDVITLKSGITRDVSKYWGTRFARVIREVDASL